MPSWASFHRTTGENQYALFQEIGTGLFLSRICGILFDLKKPELEFVTIEERDAADDFIVPFDDKRSIGRIVLTEEILN